MKRMLLLAALFVTVTCSFGYSAAKPEPASDHPLVPRFPGAEITAYDTQRSKEYLLPTGPMTGGTTGPSMKLKGKLMSVTYSAPVGTPTADILRHYEKVFKDAEFQLFFTASGEELAPHTLWAETYYPDTEKYFLQGDTRNQGFISARRDAPDGDMCVAVYVTQGWYTYPVVQLDIVMLPSGKSQKAAANRFLKDLRDNGRSVVYDITFDGTQLQKDAEKPLNELVSLLKENRKVKLFVACHTDDSKPYNEMQDIARRRAETVKRYLVNAGVDEARLQEAGVGPACPVVPHWDMSAGRKNNRIEFIVQ